MKYLFKHNNHTDYSSNPPAVIPSVSWCNYEDEIHWGADKTYDEQYFTIESLDDNNIISITQGTQTDTVTLQISKDLGNTWETAITTAPETTTQLTTLNYGERAIIKGTNATFTTVGTLAGGIHFNTSKRINISGNIGSLVYGDNFASQTALPNSDYIFRGLFGTDATTHENGEVLTKVVDASKLVLLNPTGTYAYAYMFYYCTMLNKIPQHYASSLQAYAYQGLFCGCTGLINIHIELPATVLKEGCYREMFSGCANLISAPTFTINTAATACCYSMFYNCTSLLSENTNITINATATYTNCYRSMFNGCTSLTTCPISSLPATIINNYSYAYMFQDCSSMTTVPTMTIGKINKTYAMPSMFENCTSLVTISTNTIQLNSTSQLSNSYYRLFKGCVNLIDSGITTIASTGCGGHSYAEMFMNCSKLMVAPSFTCNSQGNNNGYQSMFNGCTVLPEVNCQLNATSLKNYCYAYMFKNCKALTRIPQDKLPATTLADHCYTGMFDGCTNLTVAPELPALTLIDNGACYSYMFRNTNVMSIKAAFTTTPSSSVSNEWLEGVPNESSRTFYKNVNATWTTTGIQSVPTNWTIVLYDPDAEAT